jgi:hypothetical protein
MKHAVEEREARLVDFDAGTRETALRDLMQDRGRTLPQGDGTNLNMHLHSFFSYNAEGWSPSRLAWECRKAGLFAAGLCDFDVLDGLEEFIQAGLTLGLRATVNLETRAYLKEYAQQEITSPGEPGVTYIMGAGFARLPEPGSPAAAGQAEYAARAQERNRALLARINPHLPDLALDYDADVLPLTPTGAATERHIISAYVNKLHAVFTTPDEAAGYLAPVLGRSTDDTLTLLEDRPALEEQVRAKLAKRGGLGYEQPSPDTFPLIDDFLAWVASCNGIPMATWLDGTSDGEKDGRAMLECLQAKGAAAVNIIPDRNWNLSDPDTRAVKVANLNAIVDIANDMNLPVNIGTEMNKRGLPFVDDLGVDALSPHRETFRRGAAIMVGHTVLARYAGVGYCSDAAVGEFADVTERNAFFAAVGSLPPLTQADADTLETKGPEQAMAILRDRVAATT